MSAKNKVIDGDYKNKSIVITSLGITIMLGFFKEMIIDENTVSAFEVYDSEKTTSAMSAIGRGAVGRFFLGPVGLLAATSAKKKGTYVIAIQFRDGKSSLIEVDDEIYKKMLLLKFQNEFKSRRDQSDSTYCPSCKQEVTSNFCTNCGTQISNAIEQKKSIPNDKIINVNGVELNITRIISKYGKDKISTIKYVAHLSGASLKESKEIIDNAHEELNI